MGDFAILLLSTAAFLGFALLALGVIRIGAWVRDRYRAHVWALAAEIAETRADEIPPRGADIIELDAWSHRVREVPRLDRLMGMRHDDLVAAVLAQEREAVRLAVELRAVKNDLAETHRLAAAKERARRRHLATSRRLRSLLEQMIA